MLTHKKLGHEIGLLRGIVQNLATRPLPKGKMTDGILRDEGLATAQQRAEGLVGILRPGIEQFTQLSEMIFSRSPNIERGTAFATYQDEFFNILISDYLGRDSNSICDVDALAVEKHLADWFAKRAATRTIFVPCMIAPSRSPRFSVGPISFIFIEDVANSEYYPRTNASRELAANEFSRLLDAMRKERAHWLAIVEVVDCDQERAIEIGDLAVDLAIVALQLAAPYMTTKNMSRLATRRGPGMQLTLSVSDGQFSYGWSNKEPGISMGDGCLGQILLKTAPLITAVGNCIRSFTTGSYRLQKLEQAWCDSAYWLHQGLAEPLDSIAVAKLETAIEVLLCAVNSSGSQSRMVAALETFYGLKADAPINLHTQTTARQFAKRIAGDRSKVLHGAWSTLNGRYGFNRDGLEKFAVTVARASVLELDGYIQSPSPTDDTEAFLTWVKSRRLQAQNRPSSG
jgi:hypothetical protein